MNGIDVDLHSRILLGLASVLADSRSKASSKDLDKLVGKCPSVNLNIPDDNTIYKRSGKDDKGNQLSMTRRGQQALEALVVYCIRAPKETQLEILPRLLAHVRQLPTYSWEESSLMSGLPPSDLVTFSLVSGLLEIGYRTPEVYSQVIEVLWSFAECVMKLLATADVEYMITFVLPSLAGLSRALQLSPYLFRSEQLLTLYCKAQALIKEEALDHIRLSITVCLEEHDPSSYSRRVLAKYWEDGIPLSSNRVILDLLIILRNVATRVVAGAEPNGTTTKETVKVNRQELHMTHEINDVWSELMSRSSTAAEKSDIDLRKSMRGVYVMSLGYYDDLRKYADERAKKWAPDTYIQEIMGTSLHVAALSSVYLSEVDDVLIGQLSKCLFDAPYGYDSWVHVASLDAAVLLAVNFSQLNNIITQTICRFLATPSPVFELEAGVMTKVNNGNDHDTTNVRQFATLRLAQCVQIKPSHQLSREAISILYALLNQITQFSSADDSANISGAPSADQLTDSQHQQVCANVLAAIVDMAVFLKDESIMAQALSMLVQRHKSLSADATASLIAKLVDLALVSPQLIFEDIIDLFSTMSIDALANDDDRMATAVAEAQMDLAKRISVQPKYYHTYLRRLLILFVKSGNWIRQATAVKKQETTASLVAKLGKQLPVLRTLVDHPDYNPHQDTSEEIVSLFRDTWFHYVLYGFLTEAKWREWYDSILIIAKNTPVLVMEGASKYIESELEHNLVLRLGNTSSNDLASMRQKLTELLPSVTYDIKSFTWAQTIFAMTAYHTSMMRSRMGDCNYILCYFKNEGISNSPLANCLDQIAIRATDTFIAYATTKASLQTLLSNDLRNQLARSLELCCHRLKKVHKLAIRTTDRVVASFPQIFADKSLVTLLLELVQLLWVSCEAEYREEYCPVFQFTSQRANVTIELGDSFVYRREILAALHESARKWLRISLDRAPLEVSGLLQDYLTENDGTNMDVDHVGRTLAVQVGQLATPSLSSAGFLPSIHTISLDGSSSFISDISSRRFYAGEVYAIKQLYNESMQTSVASLSKGHLSNDLADKVASVLSALSKLSTDAERRIDISREQLCSAIYRAGAYIIALPKVSSELVRQVVRVPVQIFTPESLDIATSVWNWILVEKPDIETLLLVEVLTMWNWAQRHRKGLFSPLLNTKHPFSTKMSYTPSDKAVCENNHRLAGFLFSPHVTWIKFLSSRFYVVRHRCKHLVSMFTARLQQSFQDAHLMSTHSLAAHARFKLLRLGFKVLQSTRLEALAEYKFRSSVYDAAFQWFSMPPQWHYGARKTLALRLQKTLQDFHTALSNDKPHLGHHVSSSSKSSPSSSGFYMFLNDKTKDTVLHQFQLAQKLLKLFLESELGRLSVWCNPLNRDVSDIPSFNTERSMVSEGAWKEMVRFAWDMSPRLAVQMDARFVSPTVHPILHRELHYLIANNTLSVVDVPEALVILLGDRIQPNAKLDLKHLRYWAPVPAITAASYFLPEYGNHPLVLQYAMRSLEYYPVETVFFYIPQIVQALRFDTYGYVEEYIMEAGQVSQLFAHQIIWNMQANFFVDADKECIKADSLKPQLEKIIENLVKSFTNEDRAFYDREFEFFGQVTAISGYLKEYIKRGQTEKKPLQKKRLDEELAKIKVEIGVYLPSNPEGRVVDIHRTSGRPLQSHAKAPFMATFKIEKEKESTDTLSPVKLLKNEEDKEEAEKTVQVWQGAIFKVGDDCRQDVLALQLIAVFKNIFTSVGLDLYVFPYRVVATAPGRGVIDVIPQSISRDQLGREKVNSLYDYFVAKYGGPEAIAFQRARTNFVQSVAAYSVISYLLQIKDRHNGNIMLDDDGHIIHIDFGFIFDIAPGGITFENAPFKLTAEMIQVMGGGSGEQPFKQFSELVIKAYLACRPYSHIIIQLVSLMLQSGLPCFRGDTLRHMRTRFQTDESERGAANFMIQKIHDSFENRRTVFYDYFQKLTNDIPY